MPVCVTIKGKRHQLCAGDLNGLLTLQNREIVPPLDIDDTDYKEDFVDDGDEMCMVETINGKEVFDDSNQLIGVIDTRFYIHFRDDITAETWVLFEGERYNILNVMDLDLRHDWLRLSCDSRGSDTVAVNQA